MRDSMSDRDYLKQAYLAAVGSPDRSTQNGGVLVADCEIIGVGCNRSPQGVKITEQRLAERPLKYKVINHAEDSTLFHAVTCGNGNRIAGSTLYCPWLACSKCACVIIALRVRRVVGDARLAAKTYNSTCGWVDDVKIGLQLLEEAGVQVDYLEGEIGEVPPLRFEGKLWVP